MFKILSLSTKQPFLPQSLIKYFHVQIKKMKSQSRNLATLSLMIITVLSWTRIVAGQEALLGKKVLPLCHRECMPICMKVTEATQEICDGACQAGCVQLQGRGTGLSATDQGVDMVIA
ncbi:uncharacterized protein BNACNNG18020D [Brassica napus]|nr:uncharacterized protein BNACNNG18020D [Brassica napus]